MSSASVSEGAYKLYYMEGALTGIAPNKPLIILPHGHDEHQVWLVKKHGSDEFMVVLKGNEKLGITWSGDLHPHTPLLLGENPATFKIQEQGEGEYDLVPVKNPSLEVAMSPALIFPPLVAMMPRAVRFAWRFQKA